SLSGLVDYPSAIKDSLLKQSEKFSLKDIVKAIDIFMECQEDVRITEFGRMPLEVAIAKMTYQDADLPRKTIDQPKLEERKTSPTAIVKDAPRPRTLETFKSQKGEVETFPVKKEEFATQSADKKNTIDSSSSFSAQDTSVTLEQIRRAWNTLTFAVSRE